MSHSPDPGADVHPNPSYNGGTTLAADADTIARWLAVYDGMPGQLVVASDRDRFTGHFHPNTVEGRSAAADQLATWASEHETYLRTTTVDDDYAPAKRGARAGADDTAAVPGLWLDLDIVGPNHKRSDLPPTAEDALSLIDDLPTPSLTIASGGGLYVWWLFDEPLVITTADDLDQAKDLTRRWNQLVIERAKERGWHIDNVGELARILRPPGTFNHKTGHPVPVTVRAHSGQRHAVTDLAALLDDLAPAVEAPVIQLPPRDPGAGVSLTDDIKNRWTVADELAARGITIPRDRKITCPFPSHDDHSPSFHVYDDPDKGWACFGSSCPSNRGGAAGGGSVIDLVMWLDDVAIEDALGVLAPRVGRIPPVQPVNLLAAPPRPLPKTHETAGDDGAERPPAPPDGELPYPPGVLPRNDLGNGHRFAAAHQHHARYVYPWQAWIVWDGRRWARQVSGRIDELAKDTVETILDEAKEIDPDQRSPYLKWHVQSGNVSRMRNLLEAARSLCETPVELLDARPWEINTRDGIVDLRTGSLAPHDPDRHHTKITAAGWTPDATAPTWDRFLTQVLPDPEVRGFVQRLTGAAAVGVVRDHVLPIHFGTGANGKSTFVDTVVKALGDYARAVGVAVLMDGKRNPDAPAPEIAGLRGTRLAVAQEPELGERLRESTVKHLTGGDRIVARRLYQDPVEFAPTHSLWLVTNHKPIIRGTDDGIWRRIALVPWTVTIPPDQRDGDLPRKLEAELDGVLAWIVAGAIAWARDGLEPPAQVQAATAGYRAESDRLQPWIEDRCELGDDAREEPAVLYADYEDWCHKAADEPVTKHSFYLMLTERGFESGKSDGKRIRRGLQLRTTDDRPGSRRQQNFIEMTGGEDS